MITLPAPLAEHLQQSTTSVAYGLKITRRDGQVYAFASGSKPVTVDGVDYLVENGIDVTSLVSSAGFAVGNMTIKTLNDGTVYREMDILNGLWDGAGYELLMFDFKNADATAVVMSAGSFGEVSPGGAYIEIELRDLRQALQQPVGSVSSQTCRSEFGAAARPAGLCRKDLTGLQVSGTLTHVTSNQSFRDAGRVEASDYFGNGWLEFTSGNNAGARVLVAEYSVNGTFMVPLSLFGAVQVGDEYIAMPGCRKTEDACHAWGNYPNYQGEPNRPNRDTVIAIKEAAR